MRRLCAALDADHAWTDFEGRPIEQQSAPIMRTQNCDELDDGPPIMRNPGCVVALPPIMRGHRGAEAVDAQPAADHAWITGDSSTALKKGGGASDLFSSRIARNSGRLGMRVGYARVRPDPRDAHGQREALAGYDIEQFFFDVGRTGVNLLATELDAAIAVCGDGEELAVTKLSRLARSLAELGQVLFALAENGIRLRVGSAVFDLGAADQLLGAVISVAADFDADLAAQRATEGWRTARSSGQLPGRKPALTPEQEAEVAALAAAGAPAERLAAQFEVGRSTIYRIVARSQ